MRFANFTTFATLVTIAVAQSLAPSPTESIGCVPHDDHWHCEGPRQTVSGVAASITNLSKAVSTSASARDDAPGTGSLAPSPINSIGCESHGDHWHCSGPRETGGSSSAAAVGGMSTTTREASGSLAISRSTSAAVSQFSGGAVYKQQHFGAALLLAAAGCALAI